MPAHDLSPQDAFARHWFRDGYPLRNPAPALLPPPRQMDGLKIGDIGTIDRDGCFDSLFNICDPPDPALEDEYAFPRGFTRIKQPRIVNYRTQRSGHVFASPETSWVPRSVDAPYYTSAETLAVGRIITQYTANLSEDGTHIVVPQGAKCFKLVFQGYRLFESQANDHWSAWFNFANELRGPDLRSLYLITGLCRTRSWALASFNKKEDGQEVPVTCEVVEQDEKLQVHASRWTPLGRFDSEIGPSIDDQENDNQTIFIQSFTITSNGTIRHPNPGQLATCQGLNLTESSESTKREGTAQGSDKTGPAQPGSGGAATGETTLVHASSTTIQHVPEITLPVHPSEIINRYLLMKQPSAQAAITHDSTWLNMLARGQLLKLEDLESSIDAIVSEDYSVVFRNGVVHLRNKVMGLGNFGVNFDWSDLPINLADCIQQDDDEPCANRRFGMIYRGSLHTTHGSVLKVAITIITIESTNDSNLSEKETRAQSLAEEFVTLNHTNVLPLIWAAIESGQFAMVSPWATGGTLTSYIDDIHGRLTDVKILALIHDVATGLHYLHSKDILHGCLSGSSVVIDIFGTALLSDFGLLTLVDEHGSPLCGQSELELETVRWTAPESLPTIRNAPTKGGDIYSFGSIMLQILSGKVPYHYYERDEDVLSAISRGETPKRPDDRCFTDHRWMFIQECWSSLSTSNPKPSSKDIVVFVRHDLELALLDEHQDIDTHVRDTDVAAKDAPKEINPSFYGMSPSPSNSGSRATFNHDFTDEDANMLVQYATLLNSPQHRLYRCGWVTGHNLCNASVPGSEFSEHLRSHHGVTGSEKTPVMCCWDGCFLQMNKESLVRHINEKHLELKYTCPHCSKQFTRSFALKEHLKKHPESSD